MTKSGTNEIHGTGYLYDRPGRFDSPNPLTNTRAPFNQQQYGGVLSGPIVKNRTHFIGSYEGTNQDSQLVVTSVLKPGAFPATLNRSEGFGKVTHRLTDQHNAQLRFNLDPGADLVLADRVQIQQVLVNLFRNALEAMAQSPRRELVVTNTRVTDDMIGVEVSDTGSGFQDDVIPNLFQTFFTTKETGMGVGLSISRSIIEAHGGRMVAESNASGGATFRFTLPAADEN